MEILRHVNADKHMRMHTPDLCTQALCLVPFQNTQKIIRENLRFTRNSESVWEFFTKHTQVNFLLIENFSGLDL